MMLTKQSKIHGAPAGRVPTAAHDVTVAIWKLRAAQGEYAALRVDGAEYNRESVMLRQLAKGKTVRLHTRLTAIADELEALAIVELTNAQKQRAVVTAARDHLTETRRTYREDLRWNI